ncbi:unnamed protein product [Symbiodinium sp. CCMP2592]|nr:unnamed protein product [Symbiodinium sp. CCMP2592]
MFSFSPCRIGFQATDFLNKYFRNGRRKYGESMNDYITRKMETYWRQVHSGSDSTNLELLPEFVQAWYLLADAGLSVQERNIIHTAVKGNYTLSRVAHELRTQHGEDGGRARPAGQAYLGNMNEDYDQDENEDDTIEELFAVGEDFTEEEQNELQESQQEIESAHAIMQDARRTLRAARERQHQVKMSRKFFRGPGKGTSARPPDDSTMTCLKCGKVGHRARNCPNPEAPKNNQGKQSESAPFVCFAGQEPPENEALSPSSGPTTQAAITEGYCVVDGGATKTLGSVKALEDLFARNLAKHGKTRLQEINTKDKPVFGFGNSSEDQCVSTIKLGIQANGQPGQITIHALEAGQGPILLSVEALRKLGAIIDFEEDLVTFRNLDKYKVVPLCRSQTGHQLLDLSEDLFSKAQSTNKADLSSSPSGNLVQLTAMMKMSMSQLRQAIQERGESPPQNWGKIELRDRLTELMNEAGESTTTKTNLREWVSQLNRASRKKQELITFCTDRLKIALTGHETIPVLQQKAMKVIYSVSIPSALDTVGFGKFASKTYGQILREETKYSQWVQETYLEGGQSCEIHLQRLATWLIEQTDRISETEEETPHKITDTITPKVTDKNAWETDVFLKKDNGKGRGKPFLAHKDAGYRKAADNGAASSASASSDKEDLKVMKETVAALKAELNSLRGIMSPSDLPRKKNNEAEGNKGADTETTETDQSFQMELEKKRREALRVYVGCSVILHHCIQKGIHVTWELSERCDAWRLPLIQNILRRYQLYTAVLKGCRVNLRDNKNRLLQKGWKIMTTQARMAELMNKPCRCHGKYEHGRCEGAMAGKSACYTPEFTKLVVSGLQQELSFYGVQQEGQGISQTPDLFGGGETCVCDATCQSGHVQTCSCCVLGREHVPVLHESFVSEQKEEDESERQAREHVSRGELSFKHMDQFLSTLDLNLPRKGRGMLGGANTRPAYFQFGAYSYGKFSGKSHRTQEHPKLCHYINAFLKHHLGNEATWSSFVISIDNRLPLHRDIHNKKGQDHEEGKTGHKENTRDHEKSSSSNAPPAKNETGQVRQITAEAARQARRVEMTQEWNDEDEELNFVRLCQEFEGLVQGELRRVEEFDISSSDEVEEIEEEPTDGLMEWYQGWWFLETEVERSVRMVSEGDDVRRTAREVDACEVVLDSGADCHVLPMDWAEEVGETSNFEYHLKDAQGKVIPTLPVRQNVTFVFTKESGKKLKITDSAVCGNVTQPLFAVGKMWKLGWGTVNEDGRLLERELKNELKSKEDEDGWFVLNDGTPARFDWFMGKTFDPTGKMKRSGERVLNEVDWKSMDFFECTEIWKDRERVQLGASPQARFEVMVTLLEKGLKEPSDYGLLTNLEELERELAQEGVPMEVTGTSSGSKDKKESEKEAYQPELLQLSVGAPWDHQLKALRFKKKRIVPIDDGPGLPRLAVETDTRVEEEKRSEPSPPSDRQGSSSSSSKSSSLSGATPEAMDDESDDDDDDPGEVRTKRKAEDELVPDEMTLEEFQREVAKRNAEEEGEGSPKKEPRVDEGTGEVEERVEKVPRLGDEARGSAARVEYHIRRFAKSEDPEEHGDEYVDLDETQLFLEESREFQSKWNEKVCETEEDLTAVQGLKQLMDKLHEEDSEISSEEALATAVRREQIRGFSPGQLALGRNGDESDRFVPTANGLPPDLLVENASVEFERDVQRRAIAERAHASWHANQRTKLRKKSEVTSMRIYPEKLPTILNGTALKTRPRKLLLPDIGLPISDLLPKLSPVMMMLWERLQVPRDHVYRRTNNRPVSQTMGGGIKFHTNHGIRRYQDPSYEHRSTTSPVMMRQTRQMFLQYAAWKKWTMKKGDVSGAFLQGREYPDLLHCIPCPEILAEMGLPPGSVTQLKRACYGLVDVTQTKQGFELSQPDYTRDIKEIPLNASRRKEDDSPINERERTQLRSLLGALSWHAQQVAPHFSAEVSLLLSETSEGTVQTVKKANSLLRQAHLRQDHKMLIHGFTPDTPLGIYAWVDAAVNGEDSLYFARYQWSEMLHGEVDVRQPNDAVSRVPGYLITDSRNVYDKLTTEVLVIKGAEKKSNIELLSVKEAQMSTGIHVRWVHSEAQLANGLTKSGPSREFELFYQMQGRWRTVEDPSMMSARRRKQAGLQPLEAETKESHQREYQNSEGL